MLYNRHGRYNNLRKNEAGICQKSDPAIRGLKNTSKKSCLRRASDTGKTQTISPGTLISGWQNIILPFLSMDATGTGMKVANTLIHPRAEFNFGLISFRKTLLEMQPSGNSFLKEVFESWSYGNVLSGRWFTPLIWKTRYYHKLKLFCFQTECVKIFRIL